MEKLQKRVLTFFGGNYMMSATYNTKVLFDLFDEEDYLLVRKDDHRLYHCCCEKCIKNMEAQSSRRGWINYKNKKWVR